MSTYVLCLRMIQAQTTSLSLVVVRLFNPYNFSKENIATIRLIWSRDNACSLQLFRKLRQPFLFLLEVKTIQ